MNRQMLRAPVAPITSTARALVRIAALAASLASIGTPPAHAQTPRTWTADNGNGTFTNPLFFDEFSDPDIIRVGSDFYLTGTTMHAMPGLPVLHSTDLVNWELESYALDRLDLGPAFRLEDGKEIYGRGIWAPSFRYHAGTFHIFSNVNGQTTQHFSATSPRGPWTRTPMKVSLHDLSVLFDDDGKVWVVWGYRDLHLAQLDATLTDTIPGTTRALFGKDALIGEGSHLYKIGGKYYITSAWYAGRMRMPAARADRIEGPWEINPSISADEAFGLRQGARLRNNGNSADIVVSPGNPKARGGMAMHQGGIVQTPAGEWWGWSMFEGNSVGRLTALSPVTWKDGWPYFGLAGNLGRTPRIWVKPKTARQSAPHAPYVRNDEFSGPALANAWQWSHVPDDTKWSLTERRGFLRLHSLPASDFWWARNSLTQRAVGPQSTPTTILETAGMKPGDVAGLALLNRPFAWIGVRRGDDGFWLERFDQLTSDTARVRLTTGRVWLRAECDFLVEKCVLSYATDGAHFTPLGAPVATIFQLKTFQGVRYALFNYNALGAAGGYADFDAMHVDEPHPRGLTRPIPLGRTITLRSAGRDTPFALDGQTRFTVVDRKLGRVALRVGNRYVSVAPNTDSTSTVSLRIGRPGDAETFQWMETPYGDLILMSLRTHRYLRLETDGSVTGDGLGAEPDPADPALLHWELATNASALAPFTRYGMVNFARSSSEVGQQIYMAVSVGNDPLRWSAVNGGHPVLRSTEGMHGVRDPSIVRAPDGSKFYLIATDLNVDGRAYGWQGWDWAQSSASRHIEVWESTDLRAWSAQRHVLVAPEGAGMTFAPEAIWDPSISAYVVYWTSSLYPEGTHFSTDPNDPKRRAPLTRNQTLYATTRDFVTFTPARVMIDRPGHGTLDAVIIRDERRGDYHRFVSDRTSTGVGVTRYVSSCDSEDIYQERAQSVLAPAEEWQLVAGCITHRAMNTTYAEAPMVVRANAGDSRGEGYYLWADQKWAGAPSGNPMEEQLHPYWSADLASGNWKPLEWSQKPDYDLARGVIRHGHVFAITQAEHAALRGADLVSVAVRTPPTKSTYRVGEPLDLRGLVVTADYTDDVHDEMLARGGGGYSVSGYRPDTPGRQTVTVSYSVAGRTVTAAFRVIVGAP